MNSRVTASKSSRGSSSDLCKCTTASRAGAAAFAADEQRESGLARCGPSSTYGRLLSDAKTAAVSSLAVIWARTAGVVRVFLYRAICMIDIPVDCSDCTRSRKNIAREELRMAIFIYAILREATPSREDKLRLSSGLPA